MLALLKKEINAFFNNLLGYIVISVFLLTIGLFLWVFPTGFNIIQTGYANLDGLFVFGPFVLLFLVPAITMRFFSDEIKSGTFELLITKPVSDMQVIFSKFMAGMVLVALSILPTLIYVVAVYRFGLPPGNLDMGAAWGSYVGLLLVGFSFVSIGLFCSTISNNQVVSFVLAVFSSAFIFIGFELIYTLELFGQADLFIRSLGMYSHYTSLSRGVIDTRDLIYFSSVLAIFIILAKIKLESRKW